MASLLGGASIIISSTGGTAASTEPKYRNYLEGFNANGPTNMMTCINAPQKNTSPSGTQVYGSGADPVTVTALPMVVDYRATLKTVSIVVTVAATSFFRVGIYNAWAPEGDRLPSTLHSESAAAATNPSGVKAATLNSILDPGYYWVAIQFQNSAGSTVNVHNAASGENLGFIPAGITPVLALTKTQNFGAFASTWGNTYTQLTASSPPSMFASWAAA